MKWLLIITIFGADGDVMKVSYQQSSEEVCERTAGYYMERYEQEGTKAEYECVPSSPFIAKDE